MSTIQYEAWCIHLHYNINGLVVPRLRYLASYSTVITVVTGDSLQTLKLLHNAIAEKGFSNVFLYLENKDIVFKARWFVRLDITRARPLFVE